ncbi:polysaccharide deacetylase family protein [Alicyclobacillus fastidiosus]|uniref:Polysaccharide deacetylase n=1 Tax=Alicyclobacillus fastidiosus TaxID=392011 RepID=A0ABV5AK88_9BACL|nr:polysaccharide deacetylase [Alicyclobacillus fastidiosus]WEH09040.1 polysaccharide deacetylase [Alicyclobacillus fastidiosus]
MSSIWPNGKRVAVCLSWDVDGESAQYVRFPDRARNQLSELHQRLYGPQVGIWKVLNLLKEYEVPGTFYIPSYTAKLHPDMVEAILNDEHTVGLHGHLHHSLDQLTREEEQAVLVKSQEIFKELTGSVPRIFRSPSWELNRWSPELLVQHGVVSDSSLMDDEVPYALETPRGPLIEIPIQWLLDDAEHWNHHRANRDKAISDPDAVFRLWSTEFDGYYATGGCFVLTLHPFISGRWAYMAVLERLIKYIRSFPGVWWTTLDEVTGWSVDRLAQNQLPIRQSPAPEPLDF